MKILAPLREPGEVGPLREAGADEFYCGIAPEQWTGKFGDAWPNRRHPASAGVPNERVLGQMVAAADPAPIHVALNSPHYPAGAVEMLAEFGSHLLRNMGVGALIVADIGLLMALAEAGHARRLHLSSLATCTNAASSRFFRSLGVSRIILPRHLTLAEIEQCVIGDMDFEAFIINDGCVFEEGLCATTHDAGTFCLADGDGAEGFSAGTLEQYAFFKWTQNNCGCGSSRGFPLGPCGLCAIPRLRAAGIGSLKVVGREASLQRKYASVKLVSVARDTALAGGSAENIKEAIIALRGARSLCHEARGCYYPDLWNWNAARRRSDGFVPQRGPRKRVESTGAGVP